MVTVSSPEIPDFLYYLRPTRCLRIKQGAATPSRKSVDIHIYHVYVRGTLSNACFDNPAALVWPAPHTTLEDLIVNDIVAVQIPMTVQGRIFEFSYVRSMTKTSRRAFNVI